MITNGEKGLARKMSALRSFYGYYFKHQIIQKNPTLLVDMPKLHDKAIIRLDTDEVALLLDFVESAGHQQVSSVPADNKITWMDTSKLITCLC